MKHSVTGQESGASDAPMITPINGEYLTPFGVTPQNVLERHRAAAAGTLEDKPTPIMKRGNYFEDPSRQWFMDEYECHISHPKEGFRNKHCNMVASLDGVFSDDCIIDNVKVSARSVWECKLPRKASTPTDTIERVLQVQAQMDCTETEMAVIAELSQSDCIWRTAVVRRHEGTIKAIRKAVNIFWQHMDNGTDYEPVTSSEYSQMIGGNRRPDIIDLVSGLAENFTDEMRTNLIDATENYFNGKRAKQASEQVIEDSEIVMKAMMGGFERVRIPGYFINHTTVEYKAQPEKTKVTPAKPARTSRRFSVKESNDG